MTGRASRILQAPDPFRGVLQQARVAEAIRSHFDLSDRIHAMARAMIAGGPRFASSARPKVEALPLSQKETHDRLRDKHWCYF